MFLLLMFLSMSFNLHEVLKTLMTDFTDRSTCHYRQGHADEQLDSWVTTFIFALGTVPFLFAVHYDEFSQSLAEKCALAANQSVDCRATILFTISLNSAKV